MKGEQDSNYIYPLNQKTKGEKEMNTRCETAALKTAELTLGWGGEL